MAEVGERLTGPAAGVCPSGGPQWFFFHPRAGRLTKDAEKCIGPSPAVGGALPEGKNFRPGHPPWERGELANRPAGGSGRLPSPRPHPPPLHPRPHTTPMLQAGAWMATATDRNGPDRNGTNSVYTEATTAPGRQKSLCCTPAACTAVHAVAGFRQGLRRVPPARGRLSGVHKSGT